MVKKLPISNREKASFFKMGLFVEITGKSRFIKEVDFFINTVVGFISGVQSFIITVAGTEITMNQVYFY